MKRLMVSLLAFFMILTMFAGLSGIAPVAENMEIKTYKNTSVCGMLSAYDPESDVVSFEITTKPVKGSISVEPNGSFVYTPNSDKKGRDYFDIRELSGGDELNLVVHVKGEVLFPSLKSLGDLPFLCLHLY